MSDLITPFLDVDFTQDPRFMAGFNGPGDRDRFAAYADSAPVYPEKDWLPMAEAAEHGLDELVTRIFDQRQEGSCVANATSQAVEILQAKQFGQNRVVHLSAISLYKRIGTSAQSGAVVSDAWDEIEARGILPLDTEENKKRFPHTMPNTGFRTPFPPGWEATGKMFAGLEALAINSLAEGVSSILNGWPCVVGRSGHSICYARLVVQGGKLVMKYANSWHESWGDKGFGYDSMSMMKSAFRGAFCVRSITTPEFQQ